MGAGSTGAAGDGSAVAVADVPGDWLVPASSPLATDGDGDAGDSVLVTVPPDVAVDEVLAVFGSRGSLDELALSPKFMPTITVLPLVLTVNDFVLIRPPVESNVGPACACNWLSVFTSSDSSDSDDE